MLLGKKEVFMTNQMEPYRRAKQALADAGIPYDLKTVSSAAQGRGGQSPLGRAFENQALDIFYYLYVKKKDEERARHTIRQALRQ